MDCESFEVMPCHVVFNHPKSKRFKCAQAILVLNKLNGHCQYELLCMPLYTIISSSFFIYLKSNQDNV